MSTMRTQHAMQPRCRSVATRWLGLATPDDGWRFETIMPYYTVSHPVRCCVLHCPQYTALCDALHRAAPLTQILVCFGHSILVYFGPTILHRSIFTRLVALRIGSFCSVWSVVGPLQYSVPWPADRYSYGRSPHLGILVITLLRRIVLWVYN